MSDIIVMYSASWCPDTRRARAFLDEYHIPYQNIDLDEHPEYVEFVKSVNNGKRVIPTLVFPDGTILSEPSNQQLAEKLGIALEP